MDGVCTMYKKQIVFSFYATMQFIPAVQSCSASGDGGQELACKSPYSAYSVTKEEFFFQSLCYCEKSMSELSFPLAFRYLSGLPIYQAYQYKPI